jgi:uncharacterized repeat protein (TIGR01451 family)
MDKKSKLGRLGTASVVVVVLVTSGLIGASAQGKDTEAAVPDLSNLSHVFNFRPPSPPATSNRRGSDHEFYTALVPKRNYATGQLLDGAGNPLPLGDPPVMVVRDFAVMGSYNGGGWIFDITDPEAVQFVVNVPCNQTQNDVQLKQFGQRWVLALTRDGTGQPCVPNSFGPAGTAGIAVFDVTDPYAFTPMYSFRNTGGAHNFTFHPTKPYGWVSTGDLPGGLNHIPIIDFTNVDNPVQVADIAVEGGPHDVSFSVDGLRGFVASENNHRIYDTTNPAAPAEVSPAINPNAGTYAHGLDPTPDRTIMAATNESLALGGFFLSGSGICPGEGVTFYNIAGGMEAAPVPLGEFVADIQGPSSSVPDPRACTGHVGKMAPNSKVMVLGWYRGGARVVDFSNPSMPVERAHAVMDTPTPGAEVWSAKFYKGPYVYTSDTIRGFDVFKWTGPGTAPWLGVADLALTKTGSPARVPTGRDVTYTVSVTNGGPDLAEGVIVTDVLPPSVSFVSATASQGSCGLSQADVKCILGNLRSGATATIEIVVTARQAGTSTNTASVTSFASDPNPANNSDSVDTSVCRITSRPTSIPCP